jgi:hypothetical protein
LKVIRRMSMKINIKFVPGAVWWGFVFGGLTFGCARYFVSYVRAGNYVAALAAACLALGCGTVGGCLVYSVFSDEM